jgi:hypothetical protein
MTLSILMISVLLNNQNRENAATIINESSSLIDDTIQKKSQALLSASQQISETKRIFGIMIYLTRNRLYFDLHLMKQMYRYLTEAVLNISKTLQLSETIIYDMKGIPIAFVKINNNTLSFWTLPLLKLL